MCSYKLAFDCTNNVAEYEALLLGLQVLKRSGAKRISIYLKVMQLKDNAIPRGLVPLEELFDQNDVAQRPKLMPTKTWVEECDRHKGQAQNGQVVQIFKPINEAELH